MSLEGWKSLFEIGGVVLLFLTFIFGGGLLIVSNRINAKQAKQLREFDQKLTDAHTELGKQQERAAIAEQDASEAKTTAAAAETKAESFRLSIAQTNQRAAEAGAKAEGFRLDIAKANERAASANEIAERERLARLQLEAKLADRVLTPEGQTALKGVGASVPAGTKIDVFVYGGTLEILEIAESIENSLRAGGLAVRQWQVTGGGAVRGILVGVKADADTSVKRMALEIIKILQQTGVGASPWEFDQLVVTGLQQGPGENSDATIRIFIGSKL